MKKAFINKYLLYILSIILLVSCEKEKQEKAIHLFKQGKYLEDKGLTDSAVITYRHAIELLTHTENNSLKGELYNRLGLLFLNNSLYQNAQKAYQRGLKYNSYLVDKTNASQSLRGIGKSYAFRMKPDSALVYFIKAYRLIPQIKDKEEISRIHNNLSGMYVDFKEYDKALEHNSKSSAISRDSANIYRNFFIKGDIFNLQENYDSAWYYYSAASQSQDIYTKSGCYLELAKLAKELELNNYGEYMELYHNLSDSISISENPVAITIAENNLLSNAILKEKEQYIYWIIIILGTAILIAFYHQHRIHIEKKRNMEMDKILQNNEATIQSLHQQMSAIEKELTHAQEQKETHQRQAAIYERLKNMQETVISNIKQVGDNCKKKFIKSQAYLEIKNKLKAQNSILSQKEQDKFQGLITKDFKPYIQYLSAFTQMSQEDYYLCCLALMDFSTKECAFCRGVTNEAIRSQKIRIKDKFIKAFDTTEPFEYIF